MKSKYFLLLEQSVDKKKWKEKVNYLMKKEITIPKRIQKLRRIYKDDIDTDIPLSWDELNKVLDGFDYIVRAEEIQKYLMESIAPEDYSGDLSNKLSNDAMAIYVAINFDEVGGAIVRRIGAERRKEKWRKGENISFDETLLFRGPTSRRGISSDDYGKSTFSGPGWAESIDPSRPVMRLTTWPGKVWVNLPSEPEKWQAPLGSPIFGGRDNEENIFGEEGNIFLEELLSLPEDRLKFFGRNAKRILLILLKDPDATQKKIALELKIARKTVNETWRKIKVHLRHKILKARKADPPETT